MDKMMETIIIDQRFLMQTDISAEDYILLDYIAKAGRSLTPIAIEGKPFFEISPTRLADLFPAIVSDEEQVMSALYRLESIGHITTFTSDDGTLYYGITDFTREIYATLAGVSQEYR